MIVIRYVDPQGGPGMPEMLAPTAAIVGAVLAGEVALVTDGPFNGGSHGFIVGHVTPEAALGGLLSLIQDGDPIRIDATHRERSTAATLPSTAGSWAQPRKAA